MKNFQKATVGGGCFWCTEAVFQQFKGIECVTSGYSGGHIKNPSYREICQKTTGHAEVVQIVFDADVISYDQILEIFWTAHDPTTLNRQGNDKGPQYRSVIYYHDEEQQAVAEASKTDVATQLYSDPIVTEVGPLINFYEAEPEHQDFYERSKTFHGYCLVVISPKVAKTRAKFAHLLK